MSEDRPGGGGQTENGVFSSLPITNSILFCMSGKRQITFVRKIICGRCFVFVDRFPLQSLSGRNKNIILGTYSSISIKRNYHTGVLFFSQNSPFLNPHFILYPGCFGDPELSFPDISMLFPDSWFHAMTCFAPLVQLLGLPSHQTAGLAFATGTLLFQFVTLHLCPPMNMLGSPHLIWKKKTRMIKKCLRLKEIGAYPLGIYIFPRIVVNRLWKVIMRK